MDKTVIAIRSCQREQGNAIVWAVLTGLSKLKKSVSKKNKTTTTAKVKQAHR